MSNATDRKYFCRFCNESYYNKQLIKQHVFKKHANMMFLIRYKGDY